MSHAARQPWTAELIRLVLFPIVRARRYPGAWRRYRQWKAWEYAPSALLAEIQAAGLRAQLEHALRRVPFYRDWAAEHHLTIEAFQTPTDLAQLPIVTKSVLREQSARLLAEDADRARRFPNASGGSTGEVARFVQDSRYWVEAQAAQWFMESWWGIRPGDRAAVIWGIDRDLVKRTRKERLAEAIVQQRCLNVFAADEDVLDAYLREMERWRPRYLTGYASALALVARYLQARRRGHGLRPQAVKSTAEVLRPDERALIEAVFRCPVYDYYGSREVNNLAAECPAHDGLHVNLLTRCIEIVDDGGRPLPPGVAGRVLVTDLTNRAMPLIRYENGDIAAWRSGACPCGRRLPRLQAVLGRKSDFIVAASGRLVHGEYFTHLFYDRPQVHSFQLVQSAPDQVRLDLVMPGGGVAEFSAEVRPKLAAVLGPTTIIEIRGVPEIRPTASGKHRFTISLVEAPWRGLALGQEDGEAVLERPAAASAP